MKTNGKYGYIVIIFGLLFTYISCEEEPVNMNQGIDLTHIDYNPEYVDLDIPSHFTKMEIPEDNPLTTEGIELGRRLFYDPILSGDSTLSCAGCHFPEHGFSDPARFSKGIDGLEGKRNSMSLVNVGFFKNGLFWDGRAGNLEEQAVFPVEDPLEQHAIWPEVIEKIKNSPEYPSRYRKAFGINSSSQITQDLTVKAIAQFERTILSTNSKFDKIAQGVEGVKFSDLELLGFSLFFDEDPDVPDAECGHCHNTPLTSSDDFFNNGVQTSTDYDDFLDLGFGIVTGNSTDNGKMKAPSLRNIRYTAPYMHDGRFNTLDEVLEHYNQGGHPSATKDGLIQPLQLTPLHLDAIKAFILTFEDTSFISNPSLQNPFN